MSGAWDKAIDNRSKNAIRLAEKTEDVLRENPFLTHGLAKTYARKVLAAEARGELAPPLPPPPPRLRARPAPQPAPEPLIELDQTLLFPPEAVKDVKKEAKKDKLPPEVVEGAPYQPPLFDYKAANANPLAELAARELCRRRLLPFIQRFRPRYTPGWVHADICRRVERFVERVEKGEDPRLLLLMPPRSGKSEILSRNAPAWILGRHPEWELIAASHTASLTMTFSRYIRDVLRDPAFSAVFPDAVLDPSSQSVENWNTTQGGGYLASGQGGAITGRGAHCFPAGTLVRTPSGYATIESLKLHDKVLGYDHFREETTPTRIEAVRCTSRSDLVRITTVAGREIVATSDHPFFVVGVGYAQAEVLRVGATLLVACMPAVREVQIEEVKDVLPLLHSSQGAAGGPDVQPVLEVVPEAALRLQENPSQGAHGALLLGSLLGNAPRSEELQDMSCLPRACSFEGREQEREVLQPRVPYDCEREDAEGGVPGLLGDISTCLVPDPVLLEGLCERSSQCADARGEQLELQGWAELQPVVPHGTRAGSVSGREQVRRLRHNRTVASAPHQRPTGGQQGREPGDDVPYLSHGASQVGTDTILMVEKIRGGYVEVYDLQVEGTSNFFAEEILVHNCFFVDDIVKDNEAAQSLSQRESTWSWWNSTAYTRLAPGGGVIALMTNWHADDWAGRIQETMRLGGEVYEVVKYPAINEYGDEYLLLDDTIEQIASGEPIPAGAQMTRPQGTALHPERYSTKSMLQKKQNLVMSGQKTVWDALYQQNPVPDEGSYFKKELFRSYSTPPRRPDLYIYQAWDFAISTGKENDYTVGITIGVDHNDAVYVLDMKRFRSSDGILIAETVRDYALEWDATMIGVEDGQIWRSIETQFLKVCQEKHTYPSYEALKPLTDKMVRADPLKGRMQAGKIYFPSEAHWLKVLETEMLHFPNAKHDDCCFVAGTQVAMADGSMKRIEDVLVGDKVRTPVGPKTVLVSTRTMKDAVVFDLDGRLVGTGNHPIWTENYGWVPMQCLMNSDILQYIESQEKEESSCQEFTLQQPPTSTVSNSMGRCIAVTRTLLDRIFGSTTQGPDRSCTGSSGRTRMGGFLRGITSTTRTGITSTTTSTTSSACLSRNITGNISRNAPNEADPTRRSSILLRFAQKLLHGTNLMKVWHGTLSTVRGVGSTESKPGSYAKSVVQPSSHSSQTPNSVGSLARTRHGTKPIQVMRRPRELEGRHPVFNLTVVDAHCFYANGILVHNCDALAWAVRLTLTRTPPREKARPKEKSWKDKLRKMTRAGSHMAA